MSKQVADEVAFRERNGVKRISYQALELMLREIGYRLDRDMDCESVHRYMTGERAGESYPGMTFYPVQADNGLSAYNIQARRDANYRKLKQIREDYFCVIRGRVCEL